MEAGILPPPVLAEFAQDCGQEAKEAASPDESSEALIKAMGSLGIKAGHEDADEDIRDAFHGLMLEPGVPPTQASLDAAHGWISLEDNKEVRLALRLDLYEDIVGGGGGEEARQEDGEGEESHDAGTAGSPAPPPYSAVAGITWEDVEATAVRCNMTEVMYNQTRMKLAWMRFYGDYARRTADGGGPSG